MRITNRLVQSFLDSGLPDVHGAEREIKSTFNPLAQVQFGERAFPEFSRSLLLTTVFEVAYSNDGNFHAASFRVVLSFYHDSINDFNLAARPNH